VGGNDFLSKPVGKNELLTRVKTHLNFLDINRNLEGKVAERTKELEEKNQEIVATQQQLVQSEKMASLGVLTAGVAHEINNPVNFIHVSRQNLDMDLEAFEEFIVELAGIDAEQELLDSFRQRFKSFYTHTSTIEQGVVRISNIVKDLRIFSQLDAGEQKAVDLAECLQSTINLMRNENNRYVDFVTDFSPQQKFKCYPAQLNQVFINLITNACDAIAVKVEADNEHEKGTIRVSCHDEGDLVKIKIADDGCGIDEQHIKKIFEPFYTTKGVGDGTGLGLSISYGIVQQHNGRLSVKSDLQQGCTFVLSLPRCE
jgi:signal transduction histidine kinase